MSITLFYLILLSYLFIYIGAVQYESERSNYDKIRRRLSHSFPYISIEPYTENSAKKGCKSMEEFLISYAEHNNVAAPD